MASLWTTSRACSMSFLSTRSLISILWKEKLTKCLSSAGSRDSLLTAHGVIQARRLASHLSKTKISHIFTSNLKRAVRTAEAIRDAQHLAEKSSFAYSELEVVQLPALREKDFGSDEGKKFGQRTRAPDEESHESMQKRAAQFVDTQLAPIIASVADSSAETCNIVVVAHGLILGSLLRVLRSPSYFHPSYLAPLDAPPAWSNTGYVQLSLSPVSARPSGTAGVTSKLSDSQLSTSPRPSPVWPHLRLSMPKCNSTEHLAGLRKTRGGIGSAQHDDKQKTLTSFFAAGATSSKKRKSEGELER